MATTECVVGQWAQKLDADDLLAFQEAPGRMTRVGLYETICWAEGSKPFGLTALKDHLNDRCVCSGEFSEAALSADSG